MVINKFSGEELDQHLEVLNKSHRSIKKDVDHLNSFEGMAVFQSFEEEAATIIKAAQSLTGSHITEEGINNKIREDLKALSERKLKEADVISSDFDSRRADTLKKLDSVIYGQEKLSAEQIAQISLRNMELQGEIKGKLYGIQDTRSLEYEFKQLVEQSNYDKTLARFLMKNYYLFLDRVKELNVGDGEKGRAVHRLTQEVEKLKQNSYSEKENALLNVRESLTQKRFSTTAAKRVIQQKSKAILNQYR